jgi:SAM-dependent methyltransferase
MNNNTASFGSSAWSADAAGRLDAPAFHRNHEPIWSVLAPLLQGTRGDVLEVGSGTGQHAVAFARRLPSIVWWPSDEDETHLRSIAAWRAGAQLANLQAPMRLDLSAPAWWQPLLAADRAAGHRAIFCANVLHISPWSVSLGLFAGAANLLAPDGKLVIYGPFMRDHAHTALSNAAFDRNLRAQNATWGIRDLGDLTALAEGLGLRHHATHDMPANNFVLVFSR